MQKYIPRFEKSRKSHWWLAKTHSCNRSGSSRPTSSSRLASAGWEVEPIHPRSFTAKASENYSPFGMVNVHGARAGCFESFPEKNASATLAWQVGWLLWLLIWCMVFDARSIVLRLGWSFFSSNHGWKVVAMEPTIQMKLWWITHVILDTGILRFDLDRTVSNLTSSVNINILNMIVARFDFQKASETEGINLCKKHPNLLVYITVYTVVYIEHG